MCYALPKCLCPKFTSGLRMEVGQKLLELGQRCCTRDGWGGTKSEEIVRTKTSEDSWSSKHNIWTSVEYRRCLLFKRFYTAGLAWLCQGLGTKVLVWNKKQEWGKKISCKGWEDHGDMGTDINETGIQERRMKQGEQGWMEGRWRCDRNRTDLRMEKV